MTSCKDTDIIFFKRGQRLPLESKST